MLKPNHKTRPSPRLDVFPPGWCFSDFGVVKCQLLRFSSNEIWSNWKVCRVTTEPARMIRIQTQEKSNTRKKMSRSLAVITNTPNHYSPNQQSEIRLNSVPFT